MPWNRVAAGMAAGSVAGLAALAARYAAGVKRADREWPAQVEAGLSGLGEVDEVSIVPLVERLVPEGSGLHGEPGVSYLVSAGGRRVLFDSGLSGGKPESALVHNARVLGVSLTDLDAGHPRIEQILGVTEGVLDVPIRAVAGGLHLPVHPARTPLVPQAILGNPHPPWQPIAEADAKHVVQEIEARGPTLVALSGHDSTPWTYDAFARTFGDRYRTLRAGEELKITAAAG
jgi:hypothetical protein